jgi:uncharacterized protein YodC (DUF2158 family)
VFSVGDKVRLKSGGPIMTVKVGGTSRSMVICQWFDENGQLRQGRFDARELDEVK